MTANTDPIQYAFCCSVPLTACVEPPVTPPPVALTPVADGPPVPLSVVEVEVLLVAVGMAWVEEDVLLPVEAVAEVAAVDPAVDAAAAVDDVEIQTVPPDIPAFGQNVAASENAWEA